MKTKSLNGWRNCGLHRPARPLNIGKSFRWMNGLLGLVVSTLTAAAQPGPLQALINQAPERSEVILPRGTWNEAVVITKPLKLRGASTETSVIEVAADEPALRISSKEAVVLESLTIRWQRATSDRPVGALAAVSVRDTPLTVRSVRFQAPGTNARCPGAISALGFSDLTVERCRFEGFEFTIQFSEGAKGVVADSVIWKPGHAGITVGPDCSVEVLRCLVAGSAYHGIRCTGGRLKATDNLVIDNKNRGFYLGNKSAAGLIRNNVIQGNGTGISGFAQSEVEVANNLIAKSDFAGLDVRDTCRLHVHNNVLLNNTRALVLFNESGINKNTIQTNLCWGNKTNAENFEPTPELVHDEPRFTDAANGDFTPTEPNRFKEQGLLDASVIKALWAKWAALVRSGQQ